MTRQEAWGVVADDMRRIFGRDPRMRDLTKVDLEFLLSMGLLVKDPSERVTILQESFKFCCVVGGPGRRPR